MLSQPTPSLPTTRPRRIRRKRTKKTRVQQLQIYILQQERPPEHMRKCPNSEERFRILTRRNWVPERSRPRYEVNWRDLEGEESEDIESEHEED